MDADTAAPGSDVFISYASEDAVFATKLRKSLEYRGLAVWQDKLTIRVGDSLSEAIKRGIEQARYGIVILSRHFLSKDWTQRELRWLTALETDGRKVVLPVWHEVSLEDVKAFSPVLADRVAVSSSQGLRTVVIQLMKELAAPWAPHVLEWPAGNRVLVLPLRRHRRVHVMGEFLVTNAQYQTFCHETKIKQPRGKRFVGSGSRGQWVGSFDPWKDANFNDPQAPVVCVTLSNAKRYCSWLNRQLPKHSRAELPSPDVWRRAANTANQSEFRINRSRRRYPYVVSEAGHYGSWGLMDLVGNVWQWTVEEQLTVHEAFPVLKIAARVGPPLRQRDRETSGVWLCGGSYLDDLRKIKLRLAASALEDGIRTSHADLGFRVSGTVAIDTLPPSVRRQLLQAPDLAPSYTVSSMWRL